MDEEFYNALKLKIAPYYDKVGGHEFDHSERVHNVALNIARKEKADLDIVRAAALLHDVARLKEDKKECEDHAVEGAKIAREILREMNFHPDKIDPVCYAISVHRHSKEVKPDTKEAQIIQDADRLEVLGAIIIARVFSFDGKHGIPIYDPKSPPKEKYVPYEDACGLNHFYEKSFKLTPETFYTQAAKEMAKGRYDFLKSYVEQFLKEWNGER